MLKLNVKQLEEYFSSVYEAPAKFSRFFPLGMDKEAKAGKDLKGFGYGLPYVIEFSVSGEVKRVVLETSVLKVLVMTTFVIAQKFCFGSTQLSTNSLDTCILLTLARLPQTVNV